MELFTAARPASSGRDRSSAPLDPAQGNAHQPENSTAPVSATAPQHREHSQPMNSRSLSTMVATVARGGSNRLMQINGCRREGPPPRVHAFFWTQPLSDTAPLADASVASPSSRAKNIGDLDADQASRNTVALPIPASS
jgi:hypothetical protein